MNAIILRSGLPVVGLVVGFAAGLFAQDPHEAEPKHMGEIKAQVGMMTAGTTGPGLSGPGMLDHTFQFVGGQLVGGDPIKGAPYSAEAVTQTTQTLADGSHIVNSSSSMIYRDSEGRERREESIGKLGTMSAEGVPVKAVFISDPVAKVSYSLDASTHTAHKMVGIGGGFATTIAAVKPGTTVSTNRSFGYSTGGAAAPGMFVETHIIGGNDKSPAKVEKLGVQTMEGVQAEGTRTTATIAAGQIGNERDINIVSERWYSQELQVLVMSRHSDPRMGETVYKLTNINRAEPLRSMFEVPADYTISEPPMIKMRAPASKDDENKDEQNKNQ
ncbi:MAG TPA: hypothetical protein VKR43_05360 [Bryobacteraceae bacterium]|nr:hypothetical protein [Bryobacteraceae bacterium]